MARNWIRKLRFPEGRLLARVPESVCGWVGARTFSPWFLQMFTKWENSIGILLRSGCCQILKMQNRHREVSCVVQGHMSCQWPTISRKGHSSPRATQLRSNPSERVGKVLTHLLSGPLGAKVHPPASVGGCWNHGGGGEGRNWHRDPTCHEPKLPPATITRPLSEGAREATTKGRGEGCAWACVLGTIQRTGPGAFLQC